MPEPESDAPEAEGEGGLTSFEEELARLEACVRELESGDASLEASLKLYEDGMALAERCRGRIEAAEARVARLVRGERGLEERSLSE